jgi:hypothetical protein
LKVEAVILPQNEIVGLSYRTDVLFGQHRITHHTEGRRGGERDEKMIAAFIRAVRDPSCALTTASESLESHLMAFAAEEARLKGTVVDLSEFRTLAATSVSTISGS